MPVNPFTSFVFPEEVHPFLNTNKFELLVAKLLPFVFEFSTFAKYQFKKEYLFHLHIYPFTTLDDAWVLRIAPWLVVEFDPLCKALLRLFYLVWSVVPLCLYPPPDEPVVVKGRYPLLAWLPPLIILAEDEVVLRTTYGFDIELLTRWLEV